MRVILVVVFVALFCAILLYGAVATRSTQTSVNCTTTSSRFASPDNFRLNIDCVSSSTNTASIWITWSTQTARIGFGHELPAQTYVRPDPVPYQGGGNCIAVSGSQLLSCTSYY